MSTRCPTCGLKTWDADDLEPGNYVCTCDVQDDETVCCDPDCTCGDGDPGRPIETIDTRGAAVTAAVLRMPTRTGGDAELDLPPCDNAWGPYDCVPALGARRPHACWTWTGWPHVCRCLRCNRGAR